MLKVRQKNIFLSFRAVFLMVAVLILTVFCFAHPTAAQNTTDIYEQSIQDLNLPGIGLSVGVVELIVRIINIFLGLLGLIAVVLLIYAGFLWMTANGDPKKVQKARDIIVEALIGLVIIIFAFIIVQLVIRAVHGWANGQGEDGGGGGGGGVFPPVIERTFHVNEIQTSHIGSSGAANVRLCSAIQTIFNNSLSAESFNSQRVVNLRIAQVSAASEITISTADHWLNSGNVISYRGSGDYLTANADYRLYLPRALTDTNNIGLSACLASPSCNISGTNFVWQFRTGTEGDEMAPSITSVVPANNATGVSITPSVSIYFSEEVDATTLTPANIKVFDQNNQELTNLTNFIVNGTSVSFSFNSNLTAFQRYTVRVSGITDLCANVMIPANYEWSFTTGDQTTGLSSYYPKNTNVCPNEIIRFSFSDSMALNNVEIIISGNGDNRSLIFPAPALNGGNLSVVGSAGRLSVVNNSFTAYEFVPTPELNPNIHYEITINTNKIINAQGGRLFTSWEFTTATQSACSCAPYISYLSPSEGSRGACFTIIGSCLTGGGTAGVQTQILYNDQVESTVPSFVNDNNMVTMIPNRFGAGAGPEIKVSLTFPGVADTVVSNGQHFNVTSNSLSNGPCLLSLSPSQGQINTAVSAHGDRFGVSTGKITFFSSLLGNIINWDGAHNLINTRVPFGSTNGEVFVTDANNKNSNGIYFTVTGNGGGNSAPCDGDASTSLCQADSSLCPANYFCDTTCRCQVNGGDPNQPLRVRLNSLCQESNGSISVYPSPNPYVAKTDVCSNAIISVRFNQWLNSSSVNSTNVEVVACQNMAQAPVNNQCSGTTLPVAGTFETFIVDNSEGGLRFIPTNPLTPDTYYTITLHTGLSSSPANRFLENQFSWYFKTLANNQSCTIESVDVLPSQYTANTVGQSVNYSGSAFARACQEVAAGAGSGSWSWQSSDQNVATVGANATNNSQFSNAIAMLSNTVTRAGQANITGFFSNLSDFGVLNFSPQGGGGAPIDCDRDTTALQCQPDNNVCPANQVCNSTSCLCEVLPPSPGPPVAINNHTPTGNPVCRNIAASILFNQPMDTSSFSNLGLFFRSGTQISGSDCKPVINQPYFFCRVPTSFRYSTVAVGQPGCPATTPATGDCTQVYLYPNNPLNPSTLYNLKIDGQDSGNSVRSLVNSYLPLTANLLFTTVGTLRTCQVDYLTVNPADHTFTKSGVTQDFIAYPMTNQSQTCQGGSNSGATCTSNANCLGGGICPSQVVTPVAGVYTWTWSLWSKNDPNNIINLGATQVGNNNNQSIITVTAANVNGQAELIAQLVDSNNQTFGGSANITNFLCLDPVPIANTAGAGHYLTFYCRDRDNNPLPNARLNNIPNPVSPELSEQFVVLVDGSNVATGDAIGIRVYANPSRLSPLEWYQQKTPNPEEQPSSLKVAGYEAVKVGRTVYVAAANVENNIAYHNIYLMSYNDKASADTQNIFNQMIKNWQFNANLTLTQRGWLIRDVERLNGLGDLASYLAAYRTKNNFYPKLLSGSYVIGQSTSVWPSWQDTLSQDLGQSLPIDPVNKIINCPTVPAGYDAGSCWNDITKNFTCPSGSHVYQYILNGTNYNIYANMEYDDLTFWDGLTGGTWNKNDACTDYILTGN